MHRKNVLVPKPSSNFLLVQCTECEEKRVIFNYTSKVIDCNSCHNLLADNTGAKAKVLAKVLTTLD